MMFECLIFNLKAYIVIFVIVLLSATLWYHIYFFKPYAKFPAYRLEFRLPYWILNRRKLDILILKEAVEQAKKHEAEGMFVIWMFKPIVIVYGEENIKSVLPHATGKPSLMKVYEFTFGNGLFLSDGDRWKKQKKIISPAFHIKAVRAHASLMNNNARELVRKLAEKKGETIYDINSVLAECTLKLFFESNLGVRKGDPKKVEKTVKAIHKTLEFVLNRFFYPWLFFDSLLPLFPYARQILKLDAENRKTNLQILERIKESVLNRDQSQAIDEESDDLSTRPKTIGEVIIEGCPSFSMEDLAKEINSLIFAGFDTTSHTLMWTFFSLGLRPEIQDRVYEEVVNLEEEDIQYAEVQNLTYLDCVIKESLRMYPSPFFPRRVNEDVQCGNYTIPKDTDVTLFPFMLHRNPDIYPDPEKFDPDRFMDEHSKIKPWNFIPFAEGPRPCIAKNYAVLSMKIFLIHVLRKFEVISLDRREDLTFKWSPVLGAEREPRLRFIQRNRGPDRVIDHPSHCVHF